MRTKLLFTKNTYTLKLLLNVVTAGIEVLVYACTKEAACELSHVYTPSVNSLLLLKRYDPSQFFK
jgi:hypothetical protein